MIDAKRIITLSLSSEDGRVTTSYLTSLNNGKKSAVVVRAEPKQDSAHLVARETLKKALHGAGSSKLTAVVAELHNVWEKDPRSKVLIFSQFLGLLDLLESSLRNKNIRYGRLDGKLSLKERVSVLEKFRNDTPVELDDDTDERKSRIGSVLLMSMKAGGVGINMVAASSVFIVDPWWNAAVEDQCVSRIHRIGQTAEVVRVRKFVVKDSVEERIILLQHRKKQMACEVLSDVNDDGALTNSAPTLEDFKLLFGS
jgi:SNF2 family DNA or RNA helicase